MDSKIIETVDIIKDIIWEVSDKAQDRTKTVRDTQDDLEEEDNYVEVEYAFESGRWGWFEVDYSAGGYIKITLRCSNDAKMTDYFSDTTNVKKTTWKNIIKKWLLKYHYNL